MKVAVIPARGGSKRIPRKNIKPFCGQPMIAWSIETALASRCFDRVIVSTDDDEIATIATAIGAEAPFRRPPELSHDEAGTMPVMEHALASLSLQQAGLTHACCIYPTAPFIRQEDLRQGLDLLIASDRDYAFTVTSFGYPIQRALRLDEQGRVSMFEPAHARTRSQDLEEAFHDAGQFYWGKAIAWLEQRPVFSKQSIALRLPRYRVQDIDTPEDWIRAEWMFRQLRSDMPSNPGAAT